MNTESPVAVDKLDLILHKLSCIEDRLDQLEALTQQTPGILATVCDTADEYFQQHLPDTERLLPALDHLAQTLLQPEVMVSLQQLVAMLPVLLPAAESLIQIPGVLATAGDVLDESMAALEQQGIVPLELLPEFFTLIRAILHPERIQTLVKFVEALPELTPLVLLAKDAPELMATAVDTLDDLARRFDTSELRLQQVAEHLLVLAQQVPPDQLLHQTTQLVSALQQGQREAPAVGPLALIKALGDRDIQRLLGLVMYVSKHMSQVLLKQER